MPRHSFPNGPVTPSTSPVAVVTVRSEGRGGRSEHAKRRQDCDRCDEENASLRSPLASQRTPRSMAARAQRVLLDGRRATAEATLHPNVDLGLLMQNLG